VSWIGSVAGSTLWPERSGTLGDAIPLRPCERAIDVHIDGANTSGPTPDFDILSSRQSLVWCGRTDHRLRRDRPDRNGSSGRSSIRIQDWIIIPTRRERPIGSLLGERQPVQPFDSNLVQPTALDSHAPAATVRRSFHMRPRHQPPPAPAGDP
jgi:hypothetical protein